MKREFSFLIEGPLSGFLATFRRSWTKEAKHYVAQKTRVRLLANVAGIPDLLMPDETARISLEVFWKKRARIDSVNVYKFVEDGIFHKDRRVLHGEFKAYEFFQTEMAKVKLEIFLP